MKIADIVWVEGDDCTSASLAFTGSENWADDTTYLAEMAMDNYAIAHPEEAVNNLGYAYTHAPVADPHLIRTQSHGTLQVSRTASLDSMTTQPNQTGSSAPTMEFPNLALSGNNQLADELSSALQAIVNPDQHEVRNVKVEEKTE